MAGPASLPARTGDVDAHRSRRLYRLRPDDPHRGVGAAPRPERLPQPERAERPRLRGLLPVQHLQPARLAALRRAGAAAAVPPRGRDARPAAGARIPGMLGPLRLPQLLDASPPA